MTFDLIHRFHEVLIFLCRKNYHTVVAMAEETSYIHIVNTSIQTQGSEFYSHKHFRQVWEGRSCTVMVLSLYCNVTVMVQESLVSLIIINSTRRVINQCFFCFHSICLYVYNFICLFVCVSIS